MEIIITLFLSHFVCKDESTFTSGNLGNEDLFITWTCSTPPPVLGHPHAGSGNLPPVIAMSVESTLIRVLKSLEVANRFATAFPSCVCINIYQYIQIL